MFSNRKLYLQHSKSKGHQERIERSMNTIDQVETMPPAIMASGEVTQASGFSRFFNDFSNFSRTRSENSKLIWYGDLDVIMTS